jgi:uncharacterized protein (TIGR02246 family)
MTGDDERAIRDAVAAWMEASKAGDVPALLSLMTDDVIFTTVGRPPFGKEAFATAAIGQKSMTIDSSSDIREVKVSGALAYVRSYVSVTATPSGGTPIHREGWTLSIFTKGADGRWRLSRDANLMPPPRAAK